MKKLMMVLLIAVVSISAINAQSKGYDYKTALGVKFYPGGVTLKHFIKPKAALEGISYFYNYGSRITGLYEFYGNINGANGLKWYAGPGAHVGFWNDTWKKEYPTRDANVAIGIDGVLGLDYKFKDAPINISVDWQPSYNIAGYSYFESGWGGLGIRYTF